MAGMRHALREIRPHQARFAPTVQVVELMNFTRLSGVICCLHSLQSANFVCKECRLRSCPKFHQGPDNSCQKNPLHASTARVHGWPSGLLSASFPSTHLGDLPEPDNRTTAVSPTT